MNVLRRKVTSPLAENVNIVAEMVTRKPVAEANQKMKARGLYIL